ncbi:MAG: recombination protein RecR [Verrucomicrobia bacterium]|nr:recombination protein RecR [Verrucomicrobiota bacterium]
MASYPEILQKLIILFRKLPGVGRKTAERFAFQIISWQKSDITFFTDLLQNIGSALTFCKTCGAISDSTACPFCDERLRNSSLLCILASPKDIYTIENTRIFNGMYHVMKGLLSPLDNRGPEELNLPALEKRIETLPLKEVILAFDSTLEGDATALFLKDLLERKNILVTRLALGMPIGSSLDYLDEGTLSKALASRRP